MASRRRQRRFSALPERLEPRRLLAFDSLVISEFLAANDSTIADEDGEFSDWIEIHNPTSTSISLQGWSLTDRPDALQGWQFPAIDIAPLEYLIVFASGKDRVAADGELHTNFRLSGDGEYVALVDSQAQVVFEQLFPAQTEDVSFGLPVEQRTLIGREPSYR